MKKITLLLICLIGNFVFSHTINYENFVLRHWSIEKEHKFIDGSFMMCKNGVVFIEDANNAISKVAFSDLSNEDQKFVTSKNSWVKNLKTLGCSTSLGLRFRLRRRVCSRVCPRVQVHRWPVLW